MNAAHPRVRRDRRRRHRSGFTLLEVMAALVIFLAGVVGVLALFVTGLAVHRQASVKSEASLRLPDVRARIEEQLARTAGGGDELPRFERVPLDGRPGAPPWFFSAELVPDPEAGARGGVLARVFVFTLDAGRERGERFTMFARPLATRETLIRRARGQGVAPAAPEGSTGDSARPASTGGGR